MAKEYGYVRVSSIDQNEDRQLIALKEQGVLEPIKESIIEQLQRAKLKSQAENEARRKERQEHPERFRPKPKRDDWER